MQRMAPIRPSCRNVHGAAICPILLSNIVANGPLRPSTQIVDAAWQPVEADLGRRRSILGGSMTAVRDKTAISLQRSMSTLKAHLKYFGEIDTSSFPHSYLGIVTVKLS